METRYKIIDSQSCTENIQIPYLWIVACTIIISSFPGDKMQHNYSIFYTSVEIITHITALQSGNYGTEKLLHFR